MKKKIISIEACIVAASAAAFLNGLAWDKALWLVVFLNIVAFVIVIVGFTTGFKKFIDDGMDQYPDW